MNRLLEWVLDLLYPPKCVLCRRLLARDERDICNDCRLRLPVFSGQLPRSPYLSGSAAALRYDGAVRDSLLRYKFEGQQQYARCYAALLAAACAALPLAEIDAVTWTPVSRRRLRKRRYDQAMLLARETAALLHKPLVSTLQKQRNNPAQSTMGSAEARRANVLGVYRASAPEAIRNKTLLLVDDICTTGATASEAARTLLAGGAEAVYLAVLAAASR